ncbi:MAG: hypothetical protein B7Z58_03760 [Acidiphilium sp. 37-64-53]|uniref:Aspartyl protease n=2 Tax=Acidiphilium TaxID=522 RepID=A0A8G2CLY3_ACIRU|nr:MAG: hypothetical protein B7Z58_03760 [Acidiphilium sp. 37-64-53]SIR12026.1 Aspartyl protease [Acidiphilium rubrum]
MFVNFAFVLAGIVMMLALGGCASSGVCKPKPVALLNTAFPNSPMPIVRARMNGLPVDIMIDTGGAFSSVTPSVATALNLPVEASKSLLVAGAGGSTFTSVATVRDFQLGAARGSKILLPVLALSDHKLPDGRHLGGLIGNDILRYYDIDIDLPAQQVFLVDTFDCGTIVPWSGALHPVDFGKAGNGAPKFPVTLDGHRLTAILDTGAASSFLSEYLFHASGLAAEHPQIVGERKYSGVGNQIFIAKLYRFKTLIFGGLVWHHPIIAVGGHLAQIDNRLVIGDNLTARHEIYISNTTDQLFAR